MPIALKMNCLKSTECMCCIFLAINCFELNHYNDVMMSPMESQITSLVIVYSTVYPGADQRNHQRSASLAFVQGIHRWPVNSPHKGSVSRKMFTFDDVIMWIELCFVELCCGFVTVNLTIHFRGTERSIPHCDQVSPYGDIGLGQHWLR